MDISPLPPYTAVMDAIPLNAAPMLPGRPVLYWMSRDQRADDNAALLHAQATAIAMGSPLAVVFCLAPTFLGATVRQYGFMIDGLAETGRALEKKGIPLVLLEGDPAQELPRYVRRITAGLVVTDFDPLRIKRLWRDEVARSVPVAMHEVDAHNIVPCRFVSQKQEVGARTLRPKIHRVLHDWLAEPARLVRHPVPWPDPAPPVDWQRVRDGLRVDRSVGAVDHLRPGASAAKRVLRKFVARRLAGYPDGHNDPNSDTSSGLSAYLHFGQIAPLRVALAVESSDAPQAAKDAFLEQLVVRRELADNFCFYNDRYDSIDGFPAWACRTLDAHRADPRTPCYDRRTFELAETHDALWNAAQSTMVRHGTMHGYLRMYWAKKILEWSAMPEEALETAITLNDRYQLDGRDPNGYTGIAWSIGGVHDRPWGGRPVFGNIRYMSESGCRRKFDVDAYCRSAPKPASAA